MLKVYPIFIYAHTWVVLDSSLLNILTVYAPHSGKPEEEKEFLECSVAFGELYTLE